MSLNCYPVHVLQEKYRIQDNRIKQDELNGSVQCAPLVQSHCSLPQSQNKTKSKQILPNQSHITFCILDELICSVHNKGFASINLSS